MAWNVKQLSHTREREVPNLVTMFASRKSMAKVVVLFLVAIGLAH